VHRARTPARCKLAPVRPDQRHKLWRRWGVAAVCLTGAAVLFTGQVRAEYWYAGRTLTWSHALVISLGDWELWTLASPAVLALATRVPISRAHVFRALAVHVPVGFGITFVKILAEGFLTRALLGGGRIVFGIDRLYMGLLVYWALVAAVQFAEQRRVTQASELRASHLEAELARAQVDALKMQLHPHFLFNTLNAISGLMREDVEAADLMLAQLSELLRRSLEADGSHEVPLAHEIEWLQAYLAIQQTRFGDRLKVRIDVAQGCETALVPTLILQPVVENAVRHGFSTHTGRGHITITAERSGERLRIDVEDDGPGIPGPVRDGYGLQNTRSRLRALHAEAATLVVERRSEGRGTVSRIELPFRPENVA
jgi:signal transduction histidine kinase